MSIILPTAPANFYTPSLETLKNDVEAINGVTKGQITLFSEAPNNANSAWSQVGAGNPDLDSNKGSLVIGQAPIELIIGPSPAYSEANDEFGYKLEFTKISDIVLDIPGGGSTLLVGFAVIVGRDTFNEGINYDVRYLAEVDDILISDLIVPSEVNVTTGIRSVPVKDGDIIELPSWNLIINYAEPIT